jgi:chromosomal replication initiation ATPase DnaA
MLDALESLPLVCLDSLEAIAGNALWERALFDFYNRWKEKGEGRSSLPAAARHASWGCNCRISRPV